MTVDEAFCERAISDFVVAVSTGVPLPAMLRGVATWLLVEGVSRRVVQTGRALLMTCVKNWDSPAIEPLPAKGPKKVAIVAITNSSRFC